MCMGERVRTARLLLVLQLGLVPEAKEPQCTACCPVNIFILLVNSRQQINRGRSRTIQVVCVRFQELFP